MNNRTHSLAPYFLLMFIMVSLVLTTILPGVSASNTAKFKKITDVSAGDAFDILVDEGNDVCYVSFGASGVRLYDISSYQSPDLISLKSEENNGYAHQIYKLGSNIYVGDGYAGLTVINWSVQNNPQIINRTLGYYGWSATSDVSGEILFLASGGDLFGFDTELVIFNITLPGQLELITTAPIPGTCVDAEVVGDILFITSETIPLITFDVSNVSDPIELDRADENSQDSFATDIEIVGDYAYVANWQGPFQIFDIQDPSNISIVYESPVNQESTCVESSGDIVYLANGTEGLVLYDVSTPAIPIIVGTYTDSRYQYRIDVVRDYIFMTQQSHGFVILKMSSKQIRGYSLGSLLFSLVVATGVIAFINRKRILK